MSRTTTCPVCDAPLRLAEVSGHVPSCELLELPFIEKMNRVLDERDRREKLQASLNAEMKSTPPPWGYDR